MGSCLWTKPPLESLELSSFWQWLFFFILHCISSIWRSVLEYFSNTWVAFWFLLFVSFCLYSQRKVKLGGGESYPNFHYSPVSHFCIGLRFLCCSFFVFNTKTSVTLTSRQQALLFPDLFQMQIWTTLAQGRHSTVFQWGDLCRFLFWRWTS